MNVDEIYPKTNNALKAADLRGRAVEVVISNYKVHDFDNGKKIVLQFRGKEKTLIVNKTNAMIIASAYGSNPDGWVDKKIEIYPDKTTFQGSLVDCIRVRVPAPKADDGEEIPF